MVVRSFRCGLLMILLAIVSASVTYSTMADSIPNQSGSDRRIASHTSDRPKTGPSIEMVILDPLPPDTYNTSFAH